MRRRWRRLLASGLDARSGHLPGRLRSWRHHHILEFFFNWNRTSVETLGGLTATFATGGRLSLTVGARTDQRSARCGLFARHWLLQRENGRFEDENVVRSLGGYDFGWVRVFEFDQGTAFGHYGLELGFSRRYGRFGRRSGRRCRGPARSRSAGLNHLLTGGFSAFSGHQAAAGVGCCCVDRRCFGDFWSDDFVQTFAQQFGATVGQQTAALQRRQRRRRRVLR